MAESVSFQIRIGVAERGTSRNVTVAELGVLLTAINRAINKGPSAGLTAQYYPQRHEPLEIRSEITRVENGSILLTVVSSVSDFTQKNLIQASFLAGMLGNAGWDFTKVLSKEILRALRRIGSKVVEVSDRVEPFLDSDHSLDTIASEAVAPASQISGIVQDAKASTTPLLSKKTIYSFSFEQKGVSKIAMSFSAVNRG